MGGSPERRGENWRLTSEGRRGLVAHNSGIWGEGFLRQGLGKEEVMALLKKKNEVLTKKKSRFTLTNHGALAKTVCSLRLGGWSFRNSLPNHKHTHGSSLHR